MKIFKASESQLINMKEELTNNNKTNKSATKKHFGKETKVRENQKLN